MSYQKLPSIMRSESTKKDSLKYNPKDAIELIREKSLEEALRQAIDIGYLVYPSKDLIWNFYQKQIEMNEISELSKQNFTNIFYLNLKNVPIIEIGDICYCTNLRILNLGANYITRIESLTACNQMIRLDLHQNQLGHLPASEFWCQFSRLKLLYLHNNIINNIESIKNLSACPCLEILTLFDNPISLKNGYRHHVVNSIFTLKAFDDFLVSDDEIIEDATFDNSRFSALSKQLKVDLILHPKNTYKSELEQTIKLIEHVNKLIAHLSPVLILQKCIRGYLTRKRVKDIRLKLRS